MHVILILVIKLLCNLVYDFDKLVNDFMLIFSIFIIEIHQFLPIMAIFCVCGAQKAVYII